MRKGWKMKAKVNEDFKLVKQIREKLEANDYYCPCKIQRIPENKCMCKDFLQQGLGECHCGLYIKTEV